MEERKFRKGRRKLLSLMEERRFRKGRRKLK
jgi:hypothetical protein